MAFINLQIPRIRFSRYGLTDGLDWSNVRAVRLTYKSVAGATGVVKFDDLIIKAGIDGRVLSGIYKLRQRFVFSDGLFVDYSPAGPPTPDMFINGQAIKVVMPRSLVSRMDPQVTAVWNYLFSTKLGAYFKVRDFLDLTMSKFCLNEFDTIQHANVNSDDMIRHCSIGMVVGDRYTADQIVQSASSVASNTYVPYSESIALVLSGTPLSWFPFEGVYVLNTVASDYAYFVRTGDIPDNDGINSVTLKFNAYAPNAVGTVVPIIIINGVLYSGTTVNPTAANTQYQQVWSVSPATSVAFTTDELKSATFALLGTAGYGGLYAEFNTLQLDVSYNKLENVVVPVDDSYNPYTFTINSSDTDMLLDNQVLDTAENVPPPDVIQIIGPHYGRMLCITKTHVYPSQPNSPSLFKYSYAFRVGDGKTETVLWGAIMQGSVFIGTTVDIYRYDGDFQLLPNDTLNFTRISLGLGNPPIDRSFARNDDMLVYHSSDGYRVLLGNASTSLNYNLGLLTSGYNRHGVYRSKPSVGVQSAAFGLRGLHALFPYTDNAGVYLNEFVESGEFDYSAFMGFVNLTVGLSTPPAYTERVVTLDVGAKEWRYNTYPVDITCLYRTSDGRLVAGTRDGKVIQMEYGTSDLDNDIAVEARTPYLDNGLPLNYKELFELAITGDTGGKDMTYSVYSDLSSSPIVSDTVSLNGRAVVRRNMEGLKARRFQIRVTGEFTTLRLYDFNMSMRPVPQHRTYLDTGNIRVGAEEFHWFRQIRLMAIAYSNFFVDVYFDDVLLYTESLTAALGTAKIYTVDLERDASGRQPRLVLRTGTAAEEASTDVGFEVYWIEWVTRTSGRKNKQPRIRWDNSTNDNTPPE